MWVTEEEQLLSKFLSGHGFVLLSEPTRIRKVRFPRNARPAVSLTYTVVISTCVAFTSGHSLLRGGGRGWIRGGSLPESMAARPARRAGTPGELASGTGSRRRRRRHYYIYAKLEAAGP